MTDTSVDFYDVQRMVEDEARARRAAIDELRELIGQRERETQEAIFDLQGTCLVLQRVLNERTGHLA